MEEIVNYKKKSGENPKSAGSFVWELLKIIIIAAIIIIPIRFVVAQPFSVKGDSMEDNFSNYDYLIVDQLSYRFKEVERGDVIVFRFPQHPSEYYIKRVIGLPGETVKISNGEVYICNQKYPDCARLDESQYLSPHEKTPGNKEVEVGPDSYFVLGDNRNASSDSRSWGTLPFANIIGKVFVRAWPFSEFTVVKHPRYDF